jgi:hypothetical protein
MGPNEPDMTIGGGGSQLTPKEAAQAYKDYVMPFNSSARLGSISVTSHDSADSNLNTIWPSSGLTYLAEWKEECSTCQVDFVCLHWYGATDGSDGDTQAEAFIAYMKQAIEKVRELFGEHVKVWVTEFSAMPVLEQDPEAKIAAPFMAKALKYLDSEDAVERYSYFVAKIGFMVNADGSLTPGGQAYIQPY